MMINAIVILATGENLNDKKKLMKNILLAIVKILRFIK